MNKNIGRIESGMRIMVGILSAGFGVFLGYLGFSITGSISLFGHGLIVLVGVFHVLAGLFLIVTGALKKGPGKQIVTNNSSGTRWGDLTSSRE